MRNLLLTAAMALAGCARNPTPSLAPMEQDRSIVFPESFGPAPVVGRPGKPLTLEGATLQALVIATNDFLSPVSKDTSCWSRRDAYVYQVLRQADVIFIEIHADPSACEGQFLMLDSGVKYAISTDGRILRRLQSGEPEGLVVAPASSDAGVREGLDKLDISNAVEAPDGSPPPRIPWRLLDGGTPIDGGM
jgi:hypothetical protein